MAVLFLSGLDADAYRLASDVARQKVTHSYLDAHFLLSWLCFGDLASGTLRRRGLRHLVSHPAKRPALYERGRSPSRDLAQVTAGHIGSRDRHVSGQAGGGAGEYFPAQLGLASQRHTGLSG